MHNRAAHTLGAAVVALLVASAPALGQQPAPPRQQIPDSVRALVQEAQQIQRRLVQIRQKALEQNPELRERRDAVQATVDGAMHEADPQLERKMSRLEELKSQFVRAREAGNTQKARSLQREARQIVRGISETRARVMDREDISRKMDAFEERMLAAMNEVDPETDRLLARLDEISSELNS